MKNKSLLIFMLAFLSTLTLQLSIRAQGTAFTYQGRLNDGASPANGSYDLTFGIWKAASGSGQIGSTITNSAMVVSNGLFTVTLDFGGVFTGEDRWLEIGARTNGVGAFTTLSPRQPITATPYAILAGNVVSGGLASGSYGNAVNFNNGANQFTGAFTGNGANVTNVNAAKLGGIPASSFWQTGGNAGASPGILGTLDNQPLELWVNGARAFKIFPTAGTANIIGGSIVNTFDPGIVGATIAGGGGTYQGFTRPNYVRADFASIGGGGGNMASNVFSTVAGGFKNIASGPYSTVAGGGNNEASGFGSVIGGGGISIDNGIFGFPNIASGRNAVVGGGIGNCSSGEFSFIGGGDLNTNSSFHGTIGGGLGNIASGLRTVLYGAPFDATVGGGEFNTASGNASTVSGGEKNTASDFWTTVGGGQLNTADGEYSTVGGGRQNSATNISTVSGGYLNTAVGGGAIGGGERNLATGGDAVVGGGFHNTASGESSTVPGGENCTAAGAFSFAAGRRANAAYQGSFVWCDSLDQDGGSVTANSFTVRASGGVYLFTSAASTGVQVGAGGGSWSSISDRNVKDNFQPVNAQEILKKVTAMPLTSWNYKTQDKTIRHIGPMAQDFYAAFNIGEDDHHITTVDADGVTLAAIQGLNEKVEVRNQKSEDRIQKLESENVELKRRLGALEKFIRSQKSN